MGSPPGRRGPAAGHLLGHQPRPHQVDAEPGDLGEGRASGRADLDGLKSHERELVRAVFGRPAVGDRVAMSDLENEFYKDLPGIKDRIYEELMARKYYRGRPDKVLGVWIVIAMWPQRLSLQPTHPGRFSAASANRGSGMGNGPTP